jgi:UDP-GlcNAc:undecaprenyl-phosphate GlcNAc-1-phosphate transferase
MFNGFTLGVLMQVFFISLITCALLIEILRRYAHHLGMMDHPNDRKQHGHPIPTVGGVAMFIALILAISITSNISHAEMILLTCAFALGLLGMLDDKHNLSVSLRMMIQVTLALMVIIGAQGTITSLGSIFGIPVELQLLAIPFSLIAFVGGINAMNMIDGADGMAGSMAFITTLGATILFLISPLGVSPEFPLALLGALTGFLMFNARIFIKRAWIFMGDAGSMWLGLVVAWLLARIAQGPSDPWVVLWLFGIPLIDTLTVMFRRMRSKKSPFLADRTHIHHIFEKRGLSTGRSVLLAAAGQTVLVTIGLLFYMFHTPTFIVLGSFILLFCVYYYAMRHRP